MNDVALPPGPYFIRWGTNVYAGSPDSIAKSRLVATTGGFQSGSSGMEQTSAENEAIARTIATLPELLAAVDAVEEFLDDVNKRRSVDISRLKRAANAVTSRRRELKEQAE